MLLPEIQKKMWKTSLDWTEKNLEGLYKDKTFLQLSSVGLNVNLWWQKSYGKSLQWVFRSLNLPTEESIKALYENLHGLESLNDEQQDKIAQLENEVASLRQRLLDKGKEVNRKKTKKSAVRKRAPQIEA